LTDREDYLNSMGNNVGCVIGAEQLFGIEITRQFTILRVSRELSRIARAPGLARHCCIDIGRSRRSCGRSNGVVS
jgi:NADH:ubiquinone oxidoreductase subunit D